jgi:hypothetical protein
LNNSKWLPENYKGLGNVLAKIEGLDTLKKKLRDLEFKKPLLPVVNNVQG